MKVRPCSWFHTTSVAENKSDLRGQPEAEYSAVGDQTRVQSGMHVVAMTALYGF